MSTFKKLTVPLLLLLLLVVAFLLRSKMLLNGDFYYLVDQARDMLLAKSVVVDHKITLIGARAGLGGLFHGPLWIYMIAPFFLFAKGDPFFTLVPLFEIVNLAIIIIGFFVGLKLYGKWIGLLIALLLTISSPLIDTVQGTTNAQVLPSIVLLYLMSIITFIRGENKYFVLSLLFIGLGFQFESAFAILLIPLTLVAMLIRKKLPTRKYTLLGLLAFLVGVSTFILFDIRHKFLMTSSALHLFTNTSKPLPGYEQYAHIGFRFNDRVINLWNSLFTPLFVNEPVTALLLIVIIVLGIFMLLHKVLFTKKKKLQEQEKEYIFILLAPVIIFGVYVLYPYPLWPHYLLPITVFAVFVLAFSIQTIWEKWIITKLLVSLFLVIALLPALGWVKDNYINAPSYVPASDGSYRNQLEVAQWVLQDAHNKPYGYFVYTTGILTYNMDYLLWWQSDKNQLIAPSNLKHPMTYLIMYPHPKDDANAYNYWKKNIVRTQGKVIYTKTFSDSGITVEKLQIPATEGSADPNYYQNLIFR